MVTKKVSYKGASIADRLGQLSNFICNDGDNLKWNPTGAFDTEVGIAENRFRVSEYMAPIWNKITIKYKKVATEDEHSGSYQFYGLDNLGLETLIYERNILSTQTGTESTLTLDLLKSACASAITADTSESTILGNMRFNMPLLRDTYDDVELTAAWFDSDWTYRKGIPIQESPQILRGYGEYDGISNTQALNSINQDFWYFTVDVTYDAHMQTDFGDIRFCGFDGITELDHWRISKTDSTTAKYLVLMPWYYGFREKDYRQIWGNYGYYYGIAEAQQDVYSNPNIKYVWMYYGNSSASDASDSTLGGHSWFTDLFDDATLTWSTSGTDGTHTIAEAGGYLTSTITAGATGSVYAYEEIDTDATGNSFDVIFCVNNYYKTASGTYQHMLWVGTDTSNFVGLKLDESQATPMVKQAGAYTYFTTGNEDYAHDDTAPLYVRFRVNASYSASMGKGVTIEISNDCRSWDTIKHLVDTTDISFDVSDITRVGIGETVSSAAAGNSYMNIDWVQIIPCNNNARLYYEWQDNGEFSEFPARWAGVNYSAGTKEWARDAPNSEIDFGIAASAVYEGGTDTAPRLYIGGAAPGYTKTTIFEAKLTKHARTTNGAVRAGISYDINANNHIDVYHQLYQTAEYNETMKMVRTLSGVNTTIQEQKYEEETMADGPIWMRLILDGINNLVIGEYSRNGYDWITLGANSFNEYVLGTTFSIYLKNDGGGNGTASFDYVRCYQVGAPYNMAESFTAEQAYTDFDDINALSEVVYIYTDDFEDNDLSGARTWPYRQFTAIAGTLAVESVDPVTGTYSLKHTGNGSDSPLNQVFFKDNNIAYTATFRFKLDTQGSVGGTPYIRLWEPRASPSLNDGTLVCVDTIWNGSKQVIRLVEYDRRSGTQITSANWLGAKLGTATEYAFEIIDDGFNITVKVDGTTYLNNVAYGTRATVKKIIPGRYKGLGANGDSAGTWDDLIITPATASTIDYGNEYEFEMPITWVRNQPMMIRWKNQGSDTWNYSKQMFLNDATVYNVGATDLDKYIGMTTRINFIGDEDDSLEITQIDYEYEV
jgi:hypothetical protein